MRRFQEANSQLPLESAVAIPDSNNAIAARMSPLSAIALAIGMSLPRAEYNQPLLRAQSLVARIVWKPSSILPCQSKAVALAWLAALRSNGAAAISRA